MSISSYHYLSRNEALALKQTLEPESGLYRELERALIINGGWQTLPSGLRINTFHEAESLVGGGKESMKIVDQKVVQMVSTADQMMNGFIKVDVQLCQSLKQELKLMGVMLRIEAREQQAKSEATQKEMESTETAYTQLCQRLRKCEDEMKDLQTKLDGLRSKETDLSKQIDNLNLNRQQLEQVIRNEQQAREDAVVDLIPGVGFFGGLITGRYERMIPGASQLKGIISAATQDKERFERMLHQRNEESRELKEELEAVNDDIARKSDLKSSYRSQVKKLESERAEKDALIKALGKKIVAIENLREVLELCASKYKFFSDDIDMLQTAIECGVSDKSIYKGFFDDMRKACGFLSKALENI